MDIRQTSASTLTTCLSSSSGTIRSLKASPYLVKVSSEPEFRCRRTRFPAQRKNFQGKLIVRIVDVRGKTIGLEQHAFRHVRSPTVHRTAKDAKRNTTTPEMCTDRESVGTCAYDCSIYHMFDEKTQFRVCNSEQYSQRQLGGESQLEGENHS